MEPFEVHILGCGSALPTTRHNATSQIVRICNKQFMIDCGEGTQLQMRGSHIHFSFVNHIFISHLHGDHCFGLIGLISTFGLLGRTAPLHIYADPLLQRLMQAQLNFFCNGLKYQLHFHDIDATKQMVIYEDKSITVETIPLQHRIPCCGFLFKEKKTPDHIIRDMIDFYQIPVSELNHIKNGGDYTTPEGKTIPHNWLTTPAAAPRSYAYCSDTVCQRNIIPLIEGADLLFHEATFAHADLARAKETFHTTATQAAEIACEAKVKQLLIGHFSARYEDESILLKEARSIFPDTILAQENLRINL